MSASKDSARGAVRRQQRKYKEILHLAVSMGEELLKNGAEIYRVQETVEHVMDALGAEDYNVFVLTNGIFATVHENREDSGSMVRNVPIGSVNLENIAGLNQLSREICQGSCSIKEAQRRLGQYQEASTLPHRESVLACGIGSAGFCYLLGGHLLDCMMTFFLGMMLQSFLLAAEKRQVSKFLTDILGSAMVTIGGLVLYILDFGIQFNHVIIGGIILLMPGVSLVTAIRDLFNGDYLSGGIRLMDALLTGMCIAIGVGAAIKLFQLLGGGMLPI